MLIKTTIKTPFFIVLLLLSMGLQKGIYAQNNTFEKVFIHLNRTVFTSGSELKYTAYVCNETDTNLSTIVYFELFDCNQISMLNWKSKTQNQKTSGSRIIPESIPNGIYFLTAYTNKIRSYPSEAIQSTTVIIQRIFETPMDSICTNAEHFASDSFKNKCSEYLHVEINETSDYTLILSPDPNVETASFSISVNEVPSIPALAKASKFDAFTQQANLILKQSNIKTFAQESGFSLLSGKVFNVLDSTPLANQYVYLSYPDTSLHFNYFKTNETGEFCFLLDSTYTNTTLYLQTNSSNCSKENIKWSIDDKSLEHFNPQITAQQLLNESEKEYIIELQKREMVHRVYHGDGNQAIKDLPKSIKNNFFQSPNYIVKPSDYIELKSFQEICDNIIPSIRFKKTEDKVQIGIVIDQQVIYDNVLISVDGIPCFNTKYIESIPTKNIKQIEIINSILMHGELTFNGVIAIYTYKNEINEESFCNPFYTFKNNFYENNSPRATSVETALPIVLPDVYWNANVTMGNNQPFSFSFKKPEIGNTYSISINGLINNTIPFGFTQNIKINK